MLQRLIAFLKSRTFLFNIIAMILLFFAFVFGVRAFLDSYTLHGESITVPDLKGGDMEAAEKSLEKRNLNIILRDSLHVEDAEPGSIIEQNPTPGKKVKKGRNIYVTIQTEQPEDVAVPDLKDRSRRQALSILESVGLRVKEFHFEPDICVDCVLEQHYKGGSIEPGTRIPKGAALELTLGAGQGENMTQVPKLIGRTIEGAEKRLLEATLDLGSVNYEEGCCPTSEDSANARVYRQSPSPTSENRVRAGGSVDVWLSTDEERVDSAEVRTDTSDQQEPQQLHP